MIFAHTCLSCGCTQEPRLIEVGAVLVIRCDNCDGFIRYTHINEYPRIESIKFSIWEVCMKDTNMCYELTKNAPATRRNLWRSYLEISKKHRKKIRS